MGCLGVLCVVQAVGALLAYLCSACFDWNTSGCFVEGCV